MLDKPIIVIGCGRSGTTLLGSAIGAHSAVCYLNEPRGLWRAGMPQTDVWSEQSAASGGRIALGAEDCSPEAVALLRDLFAAKLTASGAARLCEKTPINAFRLPAIARIFPDALYVYVERDGVEVAQSIAERIEAEKWYGAHERKWTLLLELAESDDALRAFGERCASTFDRGLLEWAMSVRAARRFFAATREPVIALRYEELIGDPVGVGARLESGCALAVTGEIARFLETSVRPPRRRAPQSIDARACDLLAQWA